MPGLDENTKLLLHLDGADEATSTIDSSDNEHTINFNVTAQLDTAFKKWGTASLLLDGDSDYLNIGVSSWDLENEDCVDLTGWTDTSGDTGVSEVSPAGQWRFDTNTGAAGNASAGRRKDISLVATVFTIEIKLYHDDIGTRGNSDHFRMVAWNNTHRFFVQFGSDGIFIQNSDGDWEEQGTDLVKENGSAEWQTWRFLVDMDSENVDVYLLDIDHPQWELVATGTNPKRADTGNPGFIYLDQYGYETNDMVSHIDYFKVATGLHPATADFDIIGSNSDDWTIDCWVKMDAYSDYRCLFYQGEDDENFWTIYSYSDWGITFQNKSGGTDYWATGYGGAIHDGEWHHVALIKVANEMAIYVDGVQVTYKTDSHTDTFAASLRIGSQLSLDYFDGFIDEVRIQKSNYFNAVPADEVINISQIVGANNTALGDDSGPELRYAQSFQLSEVSVITKVDLEFFTIENSPSGNVTVRIETNNAGEPSGTLAHANATKEISPTGSQWNSWEFAKPFTLEKDTTYWIILTCDDQDNAKYWRILYNASGGYGDGFAMKSSDSGSTWDTWLADAADLNFKLYSYPDSITVPTEAYSRVSGANAIFMGANF